MLNFNWIFTLVLLIKKQRIYLQKLVILVSNVYIRGTGIHKGSAKIEFVSHTCP